MKQKLLKSGLIRPLMLLLLLLGVGGGKVWADVSTLTFTSACSGHGTADDGVNWTVISDGKESDFEEARGIHYGTSSAAVQYIKLSTSEIAGSISQVVVNASTASGVSATVGVTIGGTAFGGNAQALSSTATNYNFYGAASGEIVVTVTKPSSAKKALFVKSITVTYNPDASDLTPSDLALTGSNALTFDLFNNSSAQTISYTTSSTGAVTVSESEYVTTSVHATNKTITVTPVKATSEPQTITVLQEEDDTYAAGSKTFTVSVANSTPVINASNVNVAHDATSGSITYNITNPVEGTQLTASTTTGWISNITVEATKVNFTTTPNTDSNYREGIITLTYGEVSKDITVTQGAFVVDYATLPLTFTGGKADLPTGMTQSGLGSDYSSSNTKLKFDNTGDYLILKINEVPGILSFDIEGNDFSGGTFKVQTSTNGQTYTDLESYTTLSNKETKTFTNLSSDIRYIKWIYTSKSSGNVGVGNIRLAKHGSVVAPTFSINGGTYYTAQTVELACATEGASIKYSFDNSTWYDYSEAITVSETTTIHAKAVLNDLESDVVSTTYTISQKNDVVFNISNKELAYGESYRVTRGDGMDVVTDGYLTISTSNAKVASVNGLNITTVAVGTATITINAEEGDTYNEGSTTFTITVTAPEGQTTVPEGVGSTILFDFTNEEEANQNDWGLPVGSVNSTKGSHEYSNGTYTITMYAPDSDGFYWKSGTTNGGQYLLMGKAGASLTLPAFDKAVTQIDVEGTSIASEKVRQNIFVGETAVSTETEGAKNKTNTYAISEDQQAPGTIYTLKVTSAHNTQIKTITVHFADTEVPTISYSFPSSGGMGTYCCQYPLNLDALPTGVKAYVVTNRTSSNVTLEEIGGTIKGGVGIIFKRTDDNIQTFDLTPVNSTSEPITNLLVGTLAPTYLAERTAYGLKSGVFQPNNAGNINANRAYLPNPTGQVKNLVLQFNDATGITEARILSAEEAAEIFDLAGRRVQKATKGIYIVNGKKVAIK